MCYNFLEERFMFEDARAECRIRAGVDQAGDLASINSYRAIVFNRLDKII